MKLANTLRHGRWIALAGSLSLHATTNFYHMDTTAPGGIVPRVDITSITRTQGVAVHWQGWAGPYTVQRKSSVTGTNWVTLGVTNGTSMSIVTTGQLGLLRVSEPAPGYSGYPDNTGDPICAYCHFGQSGDWAGTAHARAYDTLVKIGMGGMASCQQCHTVGKGFSTGFINTNLTPHLAGVQCENCHGPALGHASNPRSGLPKVTQQSEACGGCHNDAHHPTYDEWKESKHAHVTEELIGEFADPVGGPARMRACGACHSGSVRLTMLANLRRPATNQLAFDGKLAGEIAMECIVCHDPHLATRNGNQLRNPVFSMAPYSYSTSATNSFANQYNANINLCGQCHNMRGALWNDTSRPPHHSPQYNLLTGTAGITSGVVVHSTHRVLTNQCAACHTHRHEVPNPTEEHPNYTGHGFDPELNACNACHVDAGIRWTNVQNEVKGYIKTVKGLLDQWALTKAPADLRAKYGALAWEYNNAGQLSNPTGTLRGPTTAEQAAVPDDIKRARFNLYLVEHDGSYGLHNRDFSIHLLLVAEEKVRSLLQ